MSAKKKTIDKDKIINAALKLAAQQGWDFTSLRDVADEAGMSLAELRNEFDDKTDILIGLGKRIDQEVLEGVSKPDSDSSPRDQLFDIMMDRFEVLNKDRDGIVAILQSFISEPKQALMSLPHLCKSMNWMLEAAGIEVRGYKGLAQLAGMNALYLSVLRIWMKDDSPDLSKTMAALDKELGRAERFAGMLGL